MSSKPEGEWVDDDVQKLTDDSKQATELDATAKLSKDVTNTNNLFNMPGLLKNLQEPAENPLLEYPKPVRRRIKALKQLQLKATKLEAEFFREVHLLECKYNEMYLPLLEKRSEIIKGDYEPKPEECVWNSSSQAVEDSMDVMLNGKPFGQDDSSIKGIPHFWTTLFKNVPILSEMVQQHDEPILEYLEDIKSVVSREPMKFCLEFHFKENPYFSNTVLTKEYVMKCELEEEEPLSFEGPEIYCCSGCRIKWHPGKDVTKRTVHKKQKHKKTRATRTVKREIQNDSFFNFFNPPIIPEGTKEEEVDDDVRQLLTSDFEIGHYLRERVIPRAVLYYTGEAVEEVTDDDEDYDEEDEEEEEDDEEDEKTEDESSNRRKNGVDNEAGDD